MCQSENAAMSEIVKVLFFLFKIVKVLVVRENYFDHISKRSDQVVVVRENFLAVSCVPSQPFSWILQSVRILKNVA